MKPESVLKWSGNHVNIIVGVAVEHNDKILMVQEAKPDIYGTWAFPGGKVDAHETVTAAAFRETKEETGYDIELRELLSIYYVEWSDQAGVSVRFNFWGMLANSSPPTNVAADVLSASWKTRVEMRALLDGGLFRPSDSTKRMAREIFQNKRYPLDLLYTSSV